MKNKAILKEYIVTYKCSTSKSGESQTDSWRKKYLGLIGVLYIIKSVHKQYFQWNPIIDSEVVFSKGMVSSNDDYEIKDGILMITTENSIYYLHLQESVVNSMKMLSMVYIRIFLLLGQRLQKVIFVLE